jgi:phosphate transport system ATP-binding protein
VNHDPLQPAHSPNGESQPHRVATFIGGSVVQAVGGDPRTGDAIVVDIHPATIVLTEHEVLATDGDIEWWWPFAELTFIAHGTNGPWTILGTERMADFGVAVANHDLDDFRRWLDLLSGDRTSAASAPALNGVVHDDPEHHEPAPERWEPSTVALLPPPTGPIDPMLAPIPPILTLAPRRDDDLAITTQVPTVVTEPHRAPASPSRRGLFGRSVHVTSVDDLAPAGESLADLDARDISAWFGSHQVLDRVSLLMAAGEVTALIGPSGCGKSTFLRILNRMHEMIPSAQLAGEVLLDGHDIYDPQRRLTQARREIGMVFQKPNPFPAMSIYDNVLASLQLTGTKATQSVKDEIVESCLTKAGLWLEVRDRLRQPGGGLSGGQQQRLCIARALAIRPRVLLMDEPCSALDPTSTRRIEQTIMQLVSEVTIVIVTHNMQQAARVSNQCAFFLAEQGTPGVIVEHGPTDAMFSNPQDPRTHDYVNGRFG